MPQEYKPFVVSVPWLLLSLFVGCSFVGWATLIWSGQAITKARIVAGMIISGMVGLMVALMLWERLAENNLGMLAGVSLLAGAGGTATLDVLLAAFFKIIRDRAGLNKTTPEK